MSGLPDKATTLIPQNMYGCPAPSAAPPPKTSAHQLRVGRWFHLSMCYRRTLLVQQTEPPQRKRGCAEGLAEDVTASFCWLNKASSGLDVIYDWRLVVPARAIHTCMPGLVAGNRAGLAPISMVESVNLPNSCAGFLNLPLHLLHLKV
jgi:hypothetical protein